jgi:hypothetical protein
MASSFFDGQLAKSEPAQSALIIMPHKGEIVSVLPPHSSPLRAVVAPRSDFQVTQQLHGKKLRCSNAVIS